MTQHNTMSFDRSLKALAFGDCMNINVIAFFEYVADSYFLPQPVMSIFQLLFFCAGKSHLHNFRLFCSDSRQLWLCCNKQSHIIKCAFDLSLFFVNLKNALHFFVPLCCTDT